jgi:hypothetical protein
MTRQIERFEASEAPPDGVCDALLALWHQRRGDWQAAHELVEGDAGNAAYWYRRAGTAVARGSLEAEWTALATELLSRSRPAAATR